VIITLALLVVPVILVEESSLSGAWDIAATAAN